MSEKTNSLFMSDLPINNPVLIDRSCFDNKSNNINKKRVCFSRGLINYLLFFVFVIAVILFLSFNTYALGITPGRTNLDFTPGETVKIDFTVVNSEKKDIDLVVLVQGELNQSIALSGVSFHMGADEESKTLSYFVTMLPNLSPGPHQSEVVVVQLPEKSPIREAYVGSVVGVATIVSIFVPYPGKYAEAELNVIAGTSGETHFVIPVHSRGELDLARVRATVDIFGALNEKIATVNSDEISVKSQERKEVVATWKPDVPSGTYRAVATLIYDEKTLQLEKQFNVGSPLLELQQIIVNNFILGEIAKFELLVENKWSQPITSAYAQMLVFNDNKEIMADFKSATYDIPALEKAILVTFWDTAGVKEGAYDSSVYLKYGQLSVQKELKLEVSRDNINIIGVGYVISRGDRATSSTTIILIVVIAVLVLINLLWFLVLRKRLKK